MELEQRSSGLTVSSAMISSKLRSMLDVRIGEETEEEESNEKEGAVRAAVWKAADNWKK